MNKENLKDLKELLSVPTKTWEEQDLIDHIINYISHLNVDYHQDEIGNLYITKGKSEYYPCFVAHLDSVHEKVEMVVKEELLPNAQEEYKLALKAYEKETNEPTGIGGDDKAGVFICLQLLKTIDNCKLFLPVAEETGCNGSKHADPEFFKNVGYAIQFDSTENNTLSKTLMGVQLFEENSNFINSVETLLLEHGYVNWLHHPYTDTMMLKKKFDFACLNLAAGYYNYHTPQEYVVVEDVQKAIDVTKKIIGTLGHQKYHFKLPKQKPQNNLWEDYFLT